MSGCRIISSTPGILAVINDDLKQMKKMEKKKTNELTSM